MRTLRTVLAVGLCLTVPCYCLVVGAFDGTSSGMLPGMPRPQDFVLPVGMTPTQGTSVPLNRDVAAVRQGVGSERQDLEVRLQKTHFYLTNLVVRGDRARQVPLEADCYELRPVGEGVPLYTWSFWWHLRPYPPRWFWLFPLASGETYIAFTPGAGLYLANVTYSRDRLIAFHEDFAPEGRRAYENVPVGLVAEKGEKDEASWSFVDGIPLVVPKSLSRDSSGNLRLTLDFTRGHFGGVLVKKKSGWECAEFDAEPAETQPANDARRPPR